MAFEEFNSTSIMRPNLPLVYIIVLNWNNAADTIKCVESLLKTEYLNIHVTLCDNGSTDASVALMESWLRTQLISFKSLRNVDGLPNDIRENGSKITIIQNDRNLGYAQGNNIGIRYALSRGADYIFVLNNDTMLAQSTISQLVNFGELHPTAALMAPKIYQPSGQEFAEVNPLNSQNPPLFMAALLPKWICPTGNSRDKNLTQPTPLVLYYAPGCAMMFRSQTFARVGLFDEMTFLYYEEFIMAEKLKCEKLVTYYVPEARVYHLHGATTAKITSAHKYIYSVVSQRYYYSRYRRISKLGLLALSMKVTLSFIFRSLTESGYRQNFILFLGSYY